MTVAASLAAATPNVRDATQLLTAAPKVSPSTSPYHFKITTSATISRLVLH